MERLENQRNHLWIASSGLSNVTQVSNWHPMPLHLWSVGRARFGHIMAHFVNFNPQVFHFIIEFNWKLAKPISPFPLDVVSECPLPTIPFGALRGNNIKIGAVRQLICDNDHIRIGNDISAKCMANGRWYYTATCQMKRNEKNCN